MNALALAQAAVLAQEVRLTAEGAIIMSGCIVMVLGLSAFCMSRILREQRPAEHHHAPLDIDTHDSNGP
ncbi:MAG: hypothetical protein ACYSUQ_09890 [Planctomycetota bacterium]|jgi:hypothetical protein